MRSIRLLNTRSRKRRRHMRRGHCSCRDMIRNMRWIINRIHADLMMEKDDWRWSLPRSEFDVGPVTTSAFPVLCARRGRISKSSFTNQRQPHSSTYPANQQQKQDVCQCCQLSFSPTSSYKRVTTRALFLSLDNCGKQLQRHPTRRQNCYPTTSFPLPKYRRPHLRPPPNPPPPIHTPLPCRT